MIDYKYFNANPRGKKTTDCVIRAISVATGKGYFQVLDELIAMTKKTGWTFNERRLEQKYLEANEFIKMKQPKDASGHRYLLRDLDKVTKSETVIVAVNGHMTVVKEGCCIDIWDCRRRCITGYYIKK